ncbi:hypothetical protein [Actinokineospora sp. NPDC004072]
MNYELFVLGAARRLARDVEEMSGIVTAMTALGMLFASNPPGIPTAGRPLTLTDYDRHGHPISQAARHYWQRWEHVLVDHGADRRRGIPSHKLATNDGWHITRAECNQALDAFAAATGHDVVLDRAFTRFLRAAARHSGFRVH